MATADASQRVEGGLVGVREGVQVFLRGGDASVAEAFLDDLEVGATGKQPGRVSVAQVVHPYAEIQTGGL
jgi:hypothetical protein